MIRVACSLTVIPQGPSFSEVARQWRRCDPILWLLVARHKFRLWKVHMCGARNVLAVQYDEYGGPNVLSLRRIAPPSPRAGDVLVEVHAASVNPVDWKVRSGMLREFFPITFPATTGR